MSGWWALVVAIDVVLITCMVIMRQQEKRSSRFPDWAYINGLTFLIVLCALAALGAGAQGLGALRW